MKYLGGKTRLKKHLAPIVNAARRPGDIVWDAFCGGLAMAEELSKGGPVLASDACVPLIALYDAVAAGWTPPALVSKAMWEAAKALPDSDPLKGWCGFCCSFSGLWFSSYATPEAVLTVASGPSKGQTFTRRYHAASLDVLRRQLPKIDTVVCMNFLEQTPHDLGGVIYCDPPYRGTLGYAGVAPFDHDAFYALCLRWADYAHVFVSEYDCPVGEVVYEAPVTRAPSMSKASAVERMYHIKRRPRPGCPRTGSGAATAPSDGTGRTPAG